MAAYEQVTAFGAETFSVRFTMTGETGLIRRQPTVSVHGRVADAEAHKRAWHMISVRRRRAAAAAEHWGVADTARTTPQTEYSTETSLTLWHRHDMRKVTP